MRHKKTTITIMLCMILTSVVAQGPNHTGTYYQNADGKAGAALKTAMCGIIVGHAQRSYSNLWTDFKTTDKRSDGKVWDIYSGISNFTFVTDQAGSYSKENDVYNREHSTPASWFNDNVPMYTDLFNLYPTDGYVNNRRGNYPYGETDSPTYKSSGSFSKLGPCNSDIGYTGVVFEPNDEYKGDLARSYFYMATCYENKIQGWTSPMHANNSYPAYKDWAINMLLRWAKEDPVSQKEIDRNNAIYSIQKNRNPYIDYPGLEQYVWGTDKDRVFSYDNYESSFTGIEYISVKTQMGNVSVYNLNGQYVGGSTDGLVKGVYIVSGKKVVIK